MGCLKRLYRTSVYTSQQTTGEKLWGFFRLSCSCLQRSILKLMVSLKGWSARSHKVLATILGYPARSGLELAPWPRFGSGTARELNRPMTSGSKPELHLNPWYFGRVLHTAEPHVRKLTSLARIEYLCSDRITICYIHKTCRFACSFTSCSPISDQINVGWVAVKLSQKLGILNSDSTKIDRIANWRTGGKRACNTAYFTYISYCDMIRTQILNQRLCSELAKLWNQWKKPRVRCGSDCWCGKTR